MQPDAKEDVVRCGNRNGKWDVVAQSLSRIARATIDSGSISVKQRAMHLHEPNSAR